MKKNFFYAMMSAIALTSAVSFTSCASDDGATVENNPTYDGTSVRTDFAFSIATGPMGGTRMIAANVQSETGAFKGMKNMFLLPFSSVPAGNTATNISTSEVKNYSLGSLSGLSSEQSSKVYSLQIPIGTNNFLFYATIDNPEITELTARGKLNSPFFNTSANSIANTDDIYFSLEKIHDNLNTNLDNQETNTKSKLEAYLNKIAQVQIGEDPVIKWSDTPNKATTDGTYTTLASLYTNFTANNNARSGSAESILRTVRDLYVTAKAIVMEGYKPVDPAPAGNVYNLAQAICNAIKTGTGESGCISVAITESAADPNDWTAAWATGMTDAEKTFPHNLKLPMGAAQLTYNSSSRTFSYRIFSNNPNYNYYVSGSETSSVDLSKICYPAELVYFDNSPLRASNSYKNADSYPKTVTNWDAAASWTDWGDDRVEPSTRAVAMRNNVNYGVALLETTVKRDVDTDVMEDNMKGIHPEATANQTDINGTKFEVTGIIIGGQPASVGWDMTNPGLKELTGENLNGREVFDQVIYDQNIVFAGSAIGTSASAANYTLVLDNYTTDANGQKPVRIALELVNKSGKDFYGKEGIIPNGHTFYLCAELDPATVASAWTTATRGISNNPETNKYRVTAETTPRIFAQDYKTSANFTITKKSLQKAYSSIPDLRSTEVLFGLSVDLKWEAGMTFNVNLQ